MLNNLITFADLFAGGGGTSTGAFMVPGLQVLWAINHDPIAIKTHAANHPETKHYQADIRTQNVKELDSVDVLWASLECTQHSKAKGGKDKDEGSFTLGWELPRYLVHCQPDYVYIENVPEFVRWGELKNGKRVKSKEGLEYLRWIKTIKDLGYINYDRRFLNAADYGCPTRRVRYFGIFSKAGCPILWPVPTHAEKDNMFGFPKWVPCKDYINLTEEGNSIFGREFNSKVTKGKRHPLSENTLRRIAGGVRKFAPEVYFIMKYYGNGDNCQSVNQPLHTIRTKESHALIKCEKIQFIQDHCHMDSYNLLDEPLRPQLTRQTKQLITVKKQFYTRALTNDYANQPLNKPSPTITTFGSDSLVTVQAQFLSKYHSNSKEGGRHQDHCQSIEQPAPTIKCIDHLAFVTSKAQFGSPTTREKFQFITAYFNSGGHPESQNQSINKPLGTVLTEPNKKALVTIDADVVDFDIKMRFLTYRELASIMGFPEDYFDKAGLKLSVKDIIKMVGNAVPVGMAKALLEPIVLSLSQINNKKTA